MIPIFSFFLLAIFSGRVLSNAHCIFNIAPGLQIRGGKGYFSIEFLEISIEN